MQPGLSAGAVKVIQSGPGLARAPPWTDAAARTIKKFLSNEYTLHADPGVYVRRSAARSATGGSGRRSCDERGARLALERGRIADPMGQRHWGRDFWRCAGRVQRAPVRFYASGGGRDRADRRDAAAARSNAA